MGILVQLMDWLQEVLLERFQGTTECGYSCYRANCSGIGVEPAALLDQFEKLWLTITRTRFAATNSCCRFKAAALDLIDLYVSTMISSNY
jgi:hypothetical protein